MAALHELLRGGPAREAQGPMACDDGTQCSTGHGPKVSTWTFKRSQGQADARHGGVPRFVSPDRSFMKDRS